MAAEPPAEALKAGEITARALERGAKLIREGVTLLEVKPDVEKAFFTTGRAAWKDGVGRLYPEELLQRVTALVDGYRASGKGTSRTP